MSEPRYTIEQIELLRRLVRTGLTKDEIIHACDSMAKMDSELGPLPSKMEQPIVTSPPISSYHAPQQLTVTNRNSGLDTTGGLMGQEPASPGNRTSLVTLLSNAGHGFQENGDGGDGGRGGVDDFHVTNEEVEALFRKGHMNVKEDIKDFLTRNRLSQNLISQSTGISQSYISQFLLHGYVMRRSTQAILYRWFLAKKRELEVMGVINSTPEQQDNSASSPHLTPHRVRPLQPRYAPYQTPTQSTPTNSSTANSGKRRERFVWKDNCLRVLEAYFKKNPYPNDMERIRLSDACNALQQSLLGNNIPEHSGVNPSKVYNWFANRRKDANRKKRMAAEPIITRTVSHDDDSIPEVDYIDDSSADLTNEGDTCMAGELEDERDEGSMMNHMGGDDDQDDAEVATQLVEVNNSIMTLMKAVEERTEDPQVKTEADT